MTKRLTTEPSAENKAKAMEMLATVPMRMEELGKRLTLQELERPMATGERSPRRVLVHLVNCESRSAEGIMHALLLRDPPYQRIHAERDLGKLMRYKQFNYDDLLRYFQFRRRALLTLLESLTERQWRRCVIREGVKGRLSVYYQARGMAIHETEHLADLHAKLRLR